MTIAPGQLQSWLFEFKLNGFILFPGFLPVDLVDGMKRQFDPLLALERDIKEKGLTGSVRGDQRYAVNLTSTLDKAGGPLNDPRARKNPLIEEIVTAILGPWRYSKVIVECPCPGCDYMGWHTDLYETTPVDRDAPKRTTVLKLHIPLVDVTEANGPMEIIPGSHRMNYVEGDAAVRTLPRVYSESLLLRRGDVILRDGELLHRGTPNRGDAPRPLYSVIYKTARV